VWSYSRLSSFYDCPHAWKLNYIDRHEKQPNFFGQFGTFGHKVLELFANGELKREELSEYFETNFDAAITTRSPQIRSCDLRQKYFDEGMSYFENCELDFGKYDVLGVEKEVHFNIDGRKFIGYIDLLLRDREGRIIIADHKSSGSPFGKRGTVKKSEAAKVDGYKKQLYLYSVAVADEYGVMPSELWWNFFRGGAWLKLPFVESEFESAKKWALDTISEIENTEIFSAIPRYFWCDNLCAVGKHCKYRYYGNS
jgi:hypothetical protein